MTTKNLKRQFDQSHNTKFPNLLVSGCSYTFNDSQQHICSWPYYLRDMVGFDQVYDCSQQGAGPSHIFHSTINEIETNTNITDQNTLVLIMWSGLTRSDLMVGVDQARENFKKVSYVFGKKFATLSVWNLQQTKSDFERWCQEYKLLVDFDAQIYENQLKIIALSEYLQNQKFKFLFLSWKNPKSLMEKIDSPLTNRVWHLLDNPGLDFIDEFAIKHRLQLSDGHPSPDAHLSWTKNCLIPYLFKKNYVDGL